MHKNTLTNCEMTVASAAPSTSMPNTPISKISMITLATEETIR